MKNVYTPLKAVFFILFVALSGPLSMHAQNWQTSTTSLTINKVWMLNSTTGWAVGSSGLILHTTNGGNSWASQASGTTQILYGVWGSDANTIWAVGTFGIILKYNGSSWASQAEKGS